MLVRRLQSEDFQYLYSFILFTVEGLRNDLVVKAQTWDRGNLD